MWPAFKLNGLGFLGRGKSKHRPRNDPSLYDGEYPFFQTGDIRAANYTLTNYSQTYNEKGLAQSKLWQPGTLCITIAANIAETAVLGIPGCFPDSVVGFVADPEKADVRFIKYYIDIIKLQMQNMSGGTAQDNLSLDKLLTFDFRVPPLPLQRRIATILAAYDDLIENNLRRIKILEEMPRALYREWFVEFKFPGHSKTPRVASEIGPIPKGWAVKAVPEVVDINPQVRISRDEEHPFVPMGCLANDSMLITDIEARAGNTGAKFQNGDTLFARITPCLENGKTGFVQFLPDQNAVACGSTEFIVLRSRTVTPEFVYLLARNEEFRANAIKSMAGASGRQRVQERCFDSFKIAMPPRPLLDRFSTNVAPSFALIQRLHLESDNLRRTRDLLLPRLLSGQVSTTPKEMAKT